MHHDITYDTAITVAESEFPAQMASNAEMFLFDDVIMWKPGVKQ